MLQIMSIFFIYQEDLKKLMWRMRKLQEGRVKFLKLFTSIV